MAKVTIVPGLDLNKENTAVLDKSHYCLPGSVWQKPSGSGPGEDKILAQPGWPVVVRPWLSGGTLFPLEQLMQICNKTFINYITIGHYMTKFKTIQANNRKFLT